MPLEEVVAGVTFTGFATTPPTIPGLQVMGIFGTVKDGLNSNRAPGGPAFTNLTNPPTIGTNFITVNNGTATVTPTQGIDTNFIETTAVIASGWTMFCIGRTLISIGSNSTMVSISGQQTVLTLNPANTNVSSHPSVYVAAQGVTMSPTSDGTIDLGAGTPLSNWRMYALSYPAGAGARPYTVYDVTGSTSKTTTTTHSRTAVGNHFNFGATATIPANVYQFCDVSAGGVATGVLTMPQLQSIRTWLLGVLAVRGVTGF